MSAIEESMWPDQQQPPATFGVYLLNDNFNMREYVQRVLMMVCEVSESQAMDVMMQANWNGNALVGSWEEDVAEHTYKALKKAGLMAVIKADDGGSSSPATSMYDDW